MQIDPSEPQSTWRAPRLRLLANNQLIVGAIRVDVTSNNHYGADQVSGDVALSADPAFGLTWWGKQRDILLDVQIATPRNSDDNPSWQSVVLANVDHLQF